jgi:hypothetical protein
MGFFVLPSLFMGFMYGKGFLQAGHVLDAQHTRGPGSALST